MMNNRRRDVLGIFIPIAWLIAAVAAFLWGWHRLPEPMASHWNATGSPNGALPRISLFAISAGVPLLAAIGAFVVTRRAPGPAGSIAPALASTTFIGVLVAGLGVLSVALNLDAPEWRAAREMSFLALAATIVAAGAGSALVSRAARTLELPSLRRAAPSVGLAATERALWISCARNRWLALLAIASAGIGFAVLAMGAAWHAITPFAVAVLMALFAHLRVRVDASGVSIGFGAWGLPRMSIALARIRRADAIHLSRFSWGYRGSIRLAGRAAIIVRRGEALRLELVDGGILSITVDDAETAAGLINDLVARKS